MNTDALSKNQPSSPKQKYRFTLTGKVVNASLDKTITVNVASKFRHPVYQKTIFRNKKYLVHDPTNQAKINDRVMIANGRKFSARKSFYLWKILKSSSQETSQTVEQSQSKTVTKDKVVETK